MVSGDKTKALGLAAITSLGPAFVDPTGASIATFLVTGTGFAIGSTFKLIKGAMASNREKKAAANMSNIPPHIRTQEMMENEFCRLVASVDDGVKKLTSHQSNGLASHIVHVPAYCIILALLLAFWLFLNAGS